MTIPDQPDSSSPENDPTGVRALLSSLPEPEPMPLYLVERINASLAAEQSQRAANAADSSVVPLLPGRRRRPGRVLLGLAGAGAAAVALVGVLGTNLLTSSQSGAASGSAATVITSHPREAADSAGPGTAHRSSAAMAAPSGAAVASRLQIRVSGTQYTRADFVTQSQALRTLLSPAFEAKRLAAPFSVFEPVSTPAGLSACLSAIGAGSAQMATADLAFYDGQPAVIIVATTNGIPTAYAVGRKCTVTDSTVLRPGISLP